MKLVLLFIFAIPLLDCADDIAVTQKTLDGKWVEINTKTDTLTFLVGIEHDYVELARGKEMRNGYLLPKNGAGSYKYKLLPDKISLYWTLSSDAYYHDYYFSQTNDTIIVENFYDRNLKGVRQTFKKLK